MVMMHGKEVSSQKPTIKENAKNHEQHTLEEISSKGAKLWSTMMSACGSPTLMKIQKIMGTVSHRSMVAGKLDNKHKPLLSLLQKACSN